MPPRGNPQRSSPLAGRGYSGALSDVFKHTAAQPADIDAKAIQLLDALHAVGRAEEACAHVKKCLEEVPREKVSNWCAFVFTLLKKFDPEFYSSMREQRGKPQPRRKDSKGVFSTKLSASAPVFVPGQIWQAREAAAEAPAAAPATAPVPEAPKALQVA